MTFRKRNIGITFNYADIEERQILRKKTLIDAAIEISGGGIIGSGVAGEVSYFSDSNTITSDPSFSFSSGKLFLNGSLYLTEIAAAQSNENGKGQIWVKNDTPNTLWFTDDTGVDYQLGVSVGDHGALSGLADDDHTQYALLAGRSGGQTLIGGNAASNSLVLQSTSDATKGPVTIDSIAVFDETNSDVAFTGSLNLKTSSVYIEEKTEAYDSREAYGQYWVKDAVPNEPWFTDDAGNNFKLYTVEAGKSTPQRVQVKNRFTTTTPDNVSPYYDEVVLDAPVSAGNIVFAFYAKTGTDITSVTSNTGTWTKIEDTGGTESVEVWYSLDAQGEDTIRFNYASNTGSDRYMTIVEYSDVKLQAPEDSNNYNGGSSTSFSVPAVTSTEKALVISGLFLRSNDLTVSISTPNWNEVDVNNGSAGESLFLLDLLGATAGSAGVDGTHATSAQKHAVIASFAATEAAGTISHAELSNLDNANDHTQYFIKSTGSLVYSVHPTGSNTLSPEFSGDNSDTVQQTIQYCLDLCPKYIDQNDRIVIKVGSGSFEGFNIRGFSGGSKIQDQNNGIIIQGSYKNVALSTGVNTGTAAAGSTSTSIVKPAAAANWTVNELRGYFVKISAGGGVSSDPYLPNVRPITENSATTFTFSSIVGVDDTTVFDIVEPVSWIITGSADPILTASNIGVNIDKNTAPVTVLGLHFTASNFDNAIYSENNLEVGIYGCEFSRSSDAGLVASYYDSRFNFDYCYLSQTSGLVVDSAKSVAFNGNYLSGGYVNVLNSNNVDMSLVSYGSETEAVVLENILYAKADLHISSGAFSAAKLTAVNHFEPKGNGFVGSGNSGWGFETKKSGYYDLTGATLTGFSGAILFENQTETYEEISSVTGSTYLSTTLVMVS